MRRSLAPPHPFCTSCAIRAIKAECFGLCARTRNPSDRALRAASISHCVSLVLRQSAAKQ